MDQTFSRFYVYGDDVKHFKVEVLLSIVRTHIAGVFLECKSVVKVIGGLRIEYIGSYIENRLFKLIMHNQTTETYKQQRSTNKCRWYVFTVHILRIPRL